MFKIRLLHELKTTYTYWRSMIDAVTFLYLTVPTVLFGYYFIRETVFQAEYGVLTSFSPALILAAMLAFTCLLAHRYYIDFADRLFLIQHKKQFMKVKLYAFLLSYVKNIGLVSILFLLLLPYFYIVNSFAVWQIVQIALVLLTMLIINEMVKYLSKKWLKAVVLILLIPLLTSTVYTVSGINYVSLLIWLGCFGIFINRFICTTKYFEIQAMLEYEASTRLQSMMIKMNPQFAGIKPEVFKRKMPFMWRKHYANSPESAITELVLKTFWRRKKLAQLYAQFILIILALLMVVPIWAHIVLIIVFFFGMKQYIQSTALEIKDSQFSKMFKIPTLIWDKGVQKSSIILVSMPIILFTLLLLIKMIILL